jgi:Mn-dependent DtxR family transcriptional regulator
MSPNYGTNEHPTDQVPDWLLGGNRKRRVLAMLARRSPHGWTVAELSDELGCGPTTVYEIVRALRPLGLLEPLPGGRLRLARKGRLAGALRALLAALAPLENESVDRPPRRRGPT